MMKLKEFGTMALIGLCLLSCRNEIAVVDNNAELQGKWNWVNSSGGIAGGTVTPQSTGIRMSVEFTTDSIVRFYTNDSLKAETKFHIIKSKTIYSQDETSVLTYDNGRIRQSFQVTSPNSLTLSDECFDCYVSKYVRIK